MTSSISSMYFVSYICVHRKKTEFTIFVSVFDTYIGVIKSVKGNKDQFFYRLAEVKSSTDLNRNSTKDLKYYQSTCNTASVLFCFVTGVHYTSLKKLPL